MIKYWSLPRITPEVLKKFRDKWYWAQTIYPSNLNDNTFQPQTKLAQRLKKWLGKAFHSIIAKAMTGGDVEYWMSVYSRLYGSSFRDIAGKVIRQIQTLPPLVMENMPMDLWIEIQFEKYWKLYVLSWEIDWIYYDWDTLVISEIKTTYSDWTKEQIDWNFQLDLYALMINLNLRIEDIECEYLFVNTTTWDVSTYRYKPDLEFIDQKLQDYIIKLH